MEIVELSAAEKLRWRFQPRDHKAGHQRPRFYGASAGQKRKGREEHTSERVTGAQLGLAACAGAKEAGGRRKPGEPARTSSGLIGSIRPSKRPREVETPIQEPDRRGSEASLNSYMEVDGRDKKGQAAPVDSGGEEEPQLPSLGSRAVEVEVNELGHHVRRTGALVWCTRCGGHAGLRLGKLLKLPCRPVKKDEAGARPTRLRRLLEGKHPVHNEEL